MFKINDHVFVKPLKKEGQIAKILNNNEYLVNIEAISYRLKEDNLEISTKNFKKSAKNNNSSHKKKKNPNYDYKNSLKIKTVDLHGVKYADLEEIVLKEISDAIIKGYKQVNLMHGIGHEVLKKALPSILDNISVISSYKETENPGVLTVYL